MRGCDLTNANLSYALLRNCDISNSQFDGALLKGVVFQNVERSGANLAMGGVIHDRRFASASSSHPSRVSRLTHSVSSSHSHSLPSAS